MNIFGEIVSPITIHTLIGTVFLLTELRVASLSILHIEGEINKNTKDLITVR